MTLQLFVEGTGSLDMEALKTASATASDALPGARLVRRGRFWVDSGRAPRVRRLNGDLLDRVSMELPGLYRSLRGDAGTPLNEIVLLGGERPGVVFRAHHGVMDGQGLLTWATGVFSALRGEPVEPALDTVTDTEFMRRVGITAGVDLWGKKVPQILTTKGSFRRRGAIFRRRTLAGPHPVVTAKLIASLNAALDVPVGIFLIPVSLRRHDPALRTTGNLSSGFMVELKPGATSREVHAEILDSLARNAETAAFRDISARERMVRIPQAVLRPAMRLADYLGNRRPSRNWSFSVSTHGRVDLADFSTNAFSAATVFAVPGRGYLSPPTLTVMEMPGRVEVVLTSDGGPAAGEAADRLLDRVVMLMSEREGRDTPIDAEGLPAADSPLALIRAHAARDGEAAALLEPTGKREMTYAQLAEQVSGLVDALRGLGVRARDRVSTILPDGIDASVFFLAAATAAVANPLNPAYSGDELDNAFEVISPALLVVSPGMSAAARAVAQRRGISIVEFARDGDSYRLTRHSGSVGAHVRGPDAGERLLLQTSGTTGHGKLVPLTWPVMLAGAHASCIAYELGPADRRLNIMPLFHIQGLVGGLLASLACGSAVVCAATPRPADVLRWLDEQRVTWFSASPAMHQRILEQAPPGWRSPATLRFVRSGSAALPAALRDRLEAFYQRPVVESYGMTEAHQIASTPLVIGDTAMAPTGSEVGFLVDGEIVQDAGVRGEVVVRGGNVISRYVHPVEANTESFTDGWFRTGDEGELTAEGRLRITGRIKELIIRGGEKVAPVEVENALMRHPAVRQAVVCGVPDPDVNEQVAAAVVLHDGASTTNAELREFARTLLAPYKVPTIFDYRAELPTTQTGKVSRGEVASELSALAGQGVPRGSGAPARRSIQPRTQLEKELSALWAEVLRVPAVELHDDFFALGGQSLEGVALLGSVNERFGSSIEPILLFDRVNTVARMATFLAQSGTSRGDGAADF